MNRDGVTMRKNGLFRVFATIDSSGTLLAQVAFEGERGAVPIPWTGKLTQGRGKEKEVMVHRERRQVMVQATGEPCGVGPSFG
jgi:hypothetical protein